MKLAFLKSVHDALLPLGWPVYNRVPHSTSLPYIVIGYNFHSEWGIKGRLSHSVMADVHLWSDNVRELYEKMDAAEVAMRELESEEFSLGQAPVLETTNLLEEEGAVHGVIRMRYKILEV